MGVDDRRVMLHLAFGALVILATLNRNSSILLVLAYALTMRDRWAWGYAGVWGAVYGLLLFTQPHSGPAIAAQDVLRLNVEQVPYVLLVNVPFALLLFTALQRRKHTPVLIRRLFWLIPFYGAALLPFALLWETRLWLPVLPILLVSILYRRPSHE